MQLRSSDDLGLYQTALSESYCVTVHFLLNTLYESMVNKK